MGFRKSVVHMNLKLPFHHRNTLRHQEFKWPRAWNPICITERRGMEDHSYCQLSWDTYVIVWEWTEGPSLGFATALAKNELPLPWV